MRNTNFKALLFILGIGAFITACKKEEITERIENTVLQEVPMDSLLSKAISVNYNPSGIAPLTAELEIETNEASTIEITVLGEEPIHKTFYNVSNMHTVPVLGLYADTLNRVVVKINTSQRSGQEIIEIQTDSLSEYLPNVEIQKANSILMEPGMHLNNLHLTDGTDFWPYPLVYDNNGDIRWYLDFESQNMFRGFKAPMELTKEHTLLFENSDRVVEYDFMGREVKSVSIPSGYLHAHHDVIKLDNGNYVVPVDKSGSTLDYQGTNYVTIEDFMIEINGTTGALVKEWDFRQLLDIDRDTLTNPVTASNTLDWFHQNAVYQDPSDGNYVISGRNQGLIKVDQNNNLMWILAPHASWGLAGPTGNGFRTDSLLLTAIDHNDNPYPANIQDGAASDPGFDWSWGQHAPLYLPNGNLLVFDNGFNRSFSNVGPYSRAVEYEIDETSMTVKQVWQYGLERGGATFSGIISDVDYLPQSGNVLFAPGIMFASNPYSKIVEVTRPGGDVVFEGTLNFKNVRGGAPQPAFGQIEITYRAERVTLYD